MEELICLQKKRLLLLCPWIMQKFWIKFPLIFFSPKLISFLPLSFILFHLSNLLCKLWIWKICFEAIQLAVNEGRNSNTQAGRQVVDFKDNSFITRLYKYKYSFSSSLMLPFLSFSLHPSLVPLHLSICFFFIFSSTRRRMVDLKIIILTI